MMNEWAKQLENKWKPRSIKHKKKFEQLLQCPLKNVAKIGTYHVCFEEKFKIGQGREGTCVYIGLSDDGCEGAVKRMVTSDCKDLAENEQRILNMMKIEKSEHTVRYLYYKPEETFTYLILELCEENLVDYVNSHTLEELKLRAPSLIYEIMNGLLVLHRTGEEVSILHRNLKPSNILVDVQGHMRLADFGISKQLSQNSSTNVTNTQAGNFWRAVESIPNAAVESDGQVKFKKQSDIQVAGMVGHYILTRGGHPFGSEDHTREGNVIDGNPVHLDKLSDNSSAKDLISWMVQHKIKDRPNAEEVLKHPYLQGPDRQFNLLVLFGNENEIKCREKDASNEGMQVRNELRADPLLSNILNWKSQIDVDVLAHMEKRFKYEEDVAALIRFMRNTNEHLKDNKTPANVKAIIGEPADYFLTKFPNVVIAVHRVVRKREDWKTRSRLKQYFIFE